MQTLHLIDASLYVFRAWHSMPPHFSDRDGAPVNAVHGFTRFLCDFLERAKPTHALAAFDESLTSSFRNNIYPAYKANRELPPAELLVQFAYCKRIAGGARTDRVVGFVLRGRRSDRQRGRARARRGFSHRHRFGRQGFRPDDRRRRRTVGFFQKRTLGCGRGQAPARRAARSGCRFSWR
jgi:hypothetical protein